MNVHVAAPSSPAALRRKIEDTIERLISLLDELEPDPDLEDGGDDEPSLGSLNLTGIGKAAAHNATPAQNCARVDASSLRNCDSGMDQRRWAYGANDERELAGEDAGEDDYRDYGVGGGY